ncbi:hypothetical protein BHM03_00028766 [Ensete ventricosum]|nr:hypothetical protein BHM03_00028766 [Ensete ventricosum]
MSQERSALSNLGEDVPPTTQPTSGGAPQPPPSLPLFGDGNPPSRTPGWYWRLFNDPGPPPPPLNLRVSTGHPRRAPILGLIGIHGQDQAFAPLLVAHGATPDDYARNAAKSQPISVSPSKGPVERQIDVIVGGSIVGGDSSSTRKAYARAEVQKRPQARCDPEITFESEGEYPNHDDALVITTRITNARVKRIMIDIGSSADILYLKAFQKADAPAKSASADTTDVELSTIPSIRRPTVTTIEEAITVAHPD